MIKELYYSEHCIETQSKQFLEKVNHLRTKHQVKIDRTKAALLVIDLQEYFVNASSHAHIPSASAIIPRILKLQNYCLQHGMVVIHTKHESCGNDMMSKWWKNDSCSSKIIPAVSSELAKVVHKTQYDAFYNSNLDALLKSHNIKQLIITGLMTHLCCETTARSAFVRGYEVFFSIDGTATYNREFHLSTMINLAHGFAIPMLISEIIGSLDAAKFKK